MMPLRTLLKPLCSMLLAGFACAALAAPQHALTLYDEPPKYPANFKHVEYVNPDAPKGGTFRKSALGSFDSLNPFINKGVPADDIDLTFDTLARQTLDEPFTSYGLIAGKIEKAPDNSWVRFYLRPEAKFSDGHPIRAEDVVFSFDTLMKSGSPLYKGYYSDVDQAIAENAEFAQWAAKERRDNDNHMIAAMFGGHATFTLSDETMDKMAEANNGLTGFHIHVCEGMNDVWDSRLNRGGISPVERLLQHNLLGPDTMLGHCIHVTPAEMDIVKESGTWLVNNPESNMGNAVGCAPVLEFFRRGIPVCMGTDAYTHDMLESLKVFLIIQRHNAAMPNVGWCEAMTMLFENNAKMASKYFDRKLGVLEAGAAADVIVMDYKPFTPLSEENIDGHMLFGMMGKNCRTTIINGRVLYKDREFVGIDEDKINAWTMAESKKLWSTLNDRVY